MNQAATFAVLGAGGLLLTKAVTGSSWGDILKGHPGAVQSSSVAPISVTGTGKAAGNAAANIVPGGKGVLPPNSGRLNANQQAFAKRLQADTGLNPAVIAAWLLSEEPASSSQAPNGANNWLNIGAFDSGSWAGGGANVWSDPNTAADATASFILGKPVNGVTAPFAAAGSIRGIASAAGQDVQAQVSAIQQSGWASSGYPDLMSIVQGFLG